MTDEGVATPNAGRGGDDMGTVPGYDICEGPVVEMTGDPLREGGRDAIRRGVDDPEAFGDDCPFPLVCCIAVNWRRL